MTEVVVIPEPEVTPEVTHEETHDTRIDAANLAMAELTARIALLERDVEERDSMIHELRSKTESHEESIASIAEMAMDAATVAETAVELAVETTVEDEEEDAGEEELVSVEPTEEEKAFEAELARRRRYFKF